MKAVSSDEFELSTGKRFYAHGLMLGISRNNDDGQERTFNIGYGSDGDIYMKTYWPEEKEEFTPDEQCEMADYVIGLWQQFKKQARA